MIEISNPTGDEYKEDIDLKDDDETLAKKIDTRIVEARDLHEKNLKIAEDNLKLFQSKIDDLANRPALSNYNSSVVIGKIFTTIRNLVGLTTDNKVKLYVLPAKDDAKSIGRAKKLEATLDDGQLRTGLDTIICECLLDTWIKRDSFMRWYWDFENDDFMAEGVPVDNLMISPEAKSIQGAEYVIYYDWKNKQWFKDNYPDQYKDINFRDYSYVKQKYPLGKDDKRGNVALYIEYWQNDLVVKKVKQEKDIILEKKANPYFEWRSPEEQLNEVLSQQFPELVEVAKASGQDLATMLLTQAEAEEAQSEQPSEIKQMIEEFKPITNFFNKPHKPFVQIPSVKRLREMYSEDMLGDHVKGIFLAMNDKKRAYADNLKGCNTKVVIDKNFFNKDQEQKIKNEPFQKIFVDMQTNQKPLYIESGKEVPASFHMDIAHDEQVIDDVFGHHEISRGTGQADTLGQDQMNATSDRTPVRLQTRALEGALLELFQGWIQLIKMFYTEKKAVKNMGKKEGFMFDEIVNDDVEDGIEPFIVPGSMLPISQGEKTQRALGLWAAGALDPFTLYSELGMNNPEELSDRLVNWIKFQMVSSEDPEDIMADLTNDPNSQGGITQNSIEQADAENKAMQNEGEVPPTPPELLSKEHVKLHFDFLKDPKIKLSDEAYDLLSIHADVDKVGLSRIMAIEMAKGTQDEGITPPKGGLDTKKGK